MKFLDKMKDKKCPNCGDFLVFITEWEENYLYRCFSCDYKLSVPLPFKQLETRRKLEIINNKLNYIIKKLGEEKREKVG